jgi:hypothetical protein
MDKDSKEIDDVLKLFWSQEESNQSGATYSKT